MAKKKELVIDEVLEEVIEEVVEKPKERKFTREAILASTEFAGVQPDFLSVLLVKPEYTLAEARKVVSAFTGKKEK